MAIEDLIKGNKNFIKNVFPKVKDELYELVKHGQHPDSMFIGCSDSRVTPDLMLGTKPGDMFILRNVGNFVPPFKLDEDFHGSAAAIEYALSVLEVKNIIVCGHSHCGACRSLYMDFTDDMNMPHVKTWLKLGQKAKERTLKNHRFNTEEEMYRVTERNSIRHQLDNLLTYPDVVKKLESKELRIFGWYYDIQTGTIEYYDENSDTFKDLEDMPL